MYTYVEMVYGLCGICLSLSLWMPLGLEGLNTFWGGTSSRRDFGSWKHPVTISRFALHRTHVRVVEND